MHFSAATRPTFLESSSPLLLSFQLNPARHNHRIAIAILNADASIKNYRGE
jgi:hypothetical protein